MVLDNADANRDNYEVDNTILRATNANVLEI